MIKRKLKQVPIWCLNWGQNAEMRDDYSYPFHLLKLDISVWVSVPHLFLPSQIFRLHSNLLPLFPYLSIFISLFTSLLVCFPLMHVFLWKSFIFDGWVSRVYFAFFFFRMNVISNFLNMFDGTEKLVWVWILCSTLLLTGYYYQFMFLRYWKFLNFLAPSTWG